MTSIGIIANPASGKDIRRLVSYATTIDNNEKVNICKRIVLAAQGMGVDEALFMPDTFMIGCAVQDSLEDDGVLSLALGLLDFELEATMDDTVRAARMMERARRGLPGGARRRRDLPRRGEGHQGHPAAQRVHRHEQRLPRNDGGHRGRHGRGGRRADGRPPRMLHTRQEDNRARERRGARHSPDRRRGLGRLLRRRAAPSGTRSAYSA